MHVSLWALSRPADSLLATGRMSQSLVPSATGDASEGRAALWRTGPRRRARGRSVKNLGSNWVMFESESPRSCPIVTPTSGLMKRSAMVVYGSPIVGLQSITDPRMVAGLATTPGAAIVPWTEAAPDALEVEYEVLGNGDDSDAEGQGPACTAIVPVPSAIPAAPVRPRGPGADGARAGPQRRHPRRTSRVQFTCRLCGVSTQRAVNPRAFHRGTLVCQCEGCGVKHKLVDHLNVFGGEAGQEAVGAGAEPRRPLQPQARSPEAEALWSNLPERFREMPKTWEGGVGLVGLLRGLGRHPDSDDDTEDLLA